MRRVGTISLILFSFVLFCLFLFQTSEVKADLLGWDKADRAATEFAGYEESGSTTFSSNIGFLIQAILSMLGVIFLVLMAYAGYTWLMARGEEAEVEKAQKIIVAAVIGLVIVVAAYSITTFVVPKILNKTTGSGSESEVGALATGCCVICEIGDPAEYKSETTQAYCDSYCDDKDKCQTEWWEGLYDVCYSGGGMYSELDESCEGSCEDDGNCFN